MSKNIYPHQMTVHENYSGFDSFYRHVDIAKLD